jgi:hypothetical protein
MKKNNFIRLGHKIISLAEQSNILQEYTTLNEDYTRRLKELNHSTDERTTGDKRPFQNHLGLRFRDRKRRKKRRRRKKINLEDFIHARRYYILNRSHVISRKKFLTDRKLIKI